MATRKRPTPRAPREDSKADQLLDRKAGIPEGSPRDKPAKEPPKGLMIVIGKAPGGMPLPPKKKRK